MIINVWLVQSVLLLRILPTRLPVPSIAVRLRVQPPGRDGTKTRPHKQVRLGIKIVALHGIAQTAGKDEAIGEKRSCSVLPKTNATSKLSSPQPQLWTPKAQRGVLK